MQELENTKSPRNYFKLLFFAVLILALFEGVWIYLVSKSNNFVMLPGYSYGEINNDLISGKGSWVSITKLGNPIQTVEVACWKSFEHCWITYATLHEGNYLSLEYELAEIARWTDDAVETVPQKTGFGCVEYLYRIDRRSETITSIRNTVDNQSETCKGIQEEPIIMHLGDGFDRLNQK